MAFVFRLQILKLIDFYWNLLIKGSRAQKQKPYELLLMLWFDEKVYLMKYV